MAYLRQDQLEQPVSRPVEVVCGAALLVLGIAAIAVGFSEAISDNPRGLWVLEAFGFGLAALGVASMIISVRLLGHRARPRNGGLLSPGAAGIEVWLDGGWGVDALLGYQSRSHDDLDVVVALAHVPHLQEVLGSRGFSQSADELPVRFVMAQPDLGRIDFHTVTFDEGGGGVQLQPNGGTFRYPPDGFTFGTILERRVPCISAEVQVMCHMGYEPKEKDAHDVLLLHQRLGIRLSRAYAPFLEGGG